MAHVAIFFGEMGGGKNYYGERFALNRNLPFFDGDDVVTEEMMKFVKRFQPIPSHIIEDYMDELFNEIANRADDLKDGTLVVAQALYRDSHRVELEKFLAQSGHTVSWFWVRPPVLQNLKQLLTRTNGWKWAYYWLINKPFFQKPTHKYGLR